MFFPYWIKTKFDILFHLETEISPFSIPRVLKINLSAFFHSSNWYLPILTLINTFIKLTFDQMVWNCPDRGDTEPLFKVTQYSKPFLFPPVSCFVNVDSFKFVLLASTCIIHLTKSTLWRKIAENLSSFSLILWEDSEWVDWKVIVFFLYLLVKLTISCLTLHIPLWHVTQEEHPENLSHPKRRKN